MIGEVLAYQASQNGDGQAYRDVLSSYDSSADYWKLNKDGTLSYDGFGYLRDENGKYINKDGSITDNAIEGQTVGSKGIESGLLNIFNLADTEESRTRVQDAMIAAGMTHTVNPNNVNDRNDWMWVGEGQIEDSVGGMKFFQNSDVGLTNKSMGIALDKNTLASFGMVDLPISLYRSDQLTRNEATKVVLNANAKALDVQPGFPTQPQIAKGIPAEPGAAPGNTWCNLASYRNDGHFFGTGQTDLMLQPGGIGYTTANQMGQNLAANYLEVPNGFTAQVMANLGMDIKMSYINPDFYSNPNQAQALSGHIATVVPGYGTYIPALGPRISQAGARMGEMWAVNGFGSAMNQSKFYWVMPDTVLKKDSWWKRQPEF